MHAQGDAIVPDGLEAATRVYLAEGTRALKQRLAAINKLLEAAHEPRLRIVQERRSA